MYGASSDEWRETSVKRGRNEDKYIIYKEIEKERERKREKKERKITHKKEAEAALIIGV